MTERQKELIEALAKILGSSEQVEAILAAIITGIGIGQKSA